MLGNGNLVLWKWLMGPWDLYPSVVNLFRKLACHMETVLIPITIVNGFDVFQPVLFLCKTIPYRITPIRDSKNFFCYIVHHVPSLTMLVQFSLEQPLWFWQSSFKSTKIFGPINFIKGTAISSVPVLNKLMRPPWPVPTTNVISTDNYCFCFIIFSLIQLHFIYSLEHSVSFSVWFSNLFCYLCIKVNCNALFCFIQQNIKLKMFKSWHGQIFIRCLVIILLLNVKTFCSCSL